MTATPPIVYIVHWNALSWIKRCVGFLVDSGHPPTRIVVVNNSCELSSQLAAALPVIVRILETGGNLGYTGGANIGIRDALRHDEELFVVMAHDVLVTGQDLAALAHIMRTDSTIGVVGPAQRTGVRAGGWWDRGRRGFADLPQDGAGPVERDWLSGALLMISSQGALDVGGFDEQLGSYVEDIDYCVRIAAAGLRVVLDPSVTIETFGRKALRVTRLVDRNHGIVAFKHDGWVGLARVAWFVVIGALRSVAGMVRPGRTLARRRLSAEHAWDHFVSLLALPATPIAAARNSEARHEEKC